MDENKVRVIREWLIPSKIKNYVHFLGYLTTTCGFIRGYSKLAVLLINLLKKDKKWE